jgi:uncharacterized membrane protein
VRQIAPNEGVVQAMELEVVAERKRRQLVKTIVCFFVSNQRIFQTNTRYFHLNINVIIIIMCYDIIIIIIIIVVVAVMIGDRE